MIGRGAKLGAGRRLAIRIDPGRGEGVFLGGGDAVALSSKGERPVYFDVQKPIRRGRFAVTLIQTRVLCGSRGPDETKE